MAGSFSAFVAGDWNDHNTWEEIFPNSGHPSPDLPGAGDIVQIELVSGTFTGNGSVQDVMVTDAPVTFTGNIAAADKFDLTNDSPGTIMVVSVSGGGISASNQLELGASVKLIANGGALLAGPSSGTGGFQDFGIVVVNGGSITTNFLEVVGTLDLENGGATLGTFEVGAPIGSVGSLIIGSSGSIVDTFGTIGLVTSGSGIATINGGRWDNQQLTIGTEGGANVTVSNGGMLTAKGGAVRSPGQLAMVVGDGVFAQATLTVDAATASVTGDLGVGRRGTGTVNLTAGGSLAVSGSLEAGGSGSLAALGETTGVGNFSIDGGVLAVAGDASLGEGAAANMTVGAGGSVGVTGTLTLGALSSGTGTLTLSGTGALLQTDALVVGGAGIGVATLGDQTEISTFDDVSVGVAQGTTSSAGTLTLLSGSDLSDGGNLTVGDAGTGSLEVDGGSLSMLGSAFIVGNAATGNGDVSIRNSTVSVLGTVTMGDAGRASVSVNTAGELTATSIVIGEAIGSNGGFALDGAGSSAQSGDITIGAAGVGGLQVTNSAALGTTGAATLASESGPVQQTATIDTKATWQIGGLLEVGLAGSGELAVQGAGQVSAAQIVVADDIDADGTIAVSGSVGGIASAISFGTSLVVGDSGSGTLQVSGGASVGPGTAGTGTVAIAALTGATGVVSLTDAGSSLHAAMLAVGGTTTAKGGTGSLEIGAGATVAVDTATVWQTGTVLLTGGTLLTDPITIDGTLSGFGTVGGVVSDAGAIVASDGTLEFGGDVGGAGVLELAGGSTLRLDAALQPDPQIVFDSGKPETMILEVPGTSLANTVTDLASGDRIEFGGGMTIDAVAMLSASTAEISFTGSDGLHGTYDLTSVGFAGSAGGFTNGVDNSNGDSFIQAALCFCAGTGIATPNGEVPVERLAVGDLVLTHSGAARPIVWIGVGRVLATRGRRNAATPVIVRKSAFGENLPHSDLRVTKGHAFYFDGVLIPLEFLVNHRSIIWDDHAQEVSLFHIELAVHDVVLANGAPAESYRDDGNRWLFHNANSGWHLPPQQPSAPVLTGGPIVDAVWRRLLHRAGPRPGLALTDDPDLHLRVGGERLEPVSRHGMAYIFRLPVGTAAVRIVSRANAPAELGVARDPRVLGVALRRIALRQGARFRVVEANEPLLAEGFYEFEPQDRLRWTDGDAALPQGLFEGFDGPTELVLHVAGTTQYQLFGAPALLDAA